MDFHETLTTADPPRDSIIYCPLYCMLSQRQAVDLSMNGCVCVCVCSLVIYIYYRCGVCVRVCVVHSFSAAVLPNVAMLVQMVVAIKRSDGRTALL